MATTKVRALINGVRDNGKKYAKGDEFDMEISLVDPHVKAGQVEIANKQSAVSDQRSGK